jgi:hypothetical protein
MWRHLPPPLVRHGEPTIRGTVTRDSERWVTFLRLENPPGGRASRSATESTARRMAFLPAAGPSHISVELDVVVRDMTAQLQVVRFGTDGSLTGVFAVSSWAAFSGTRP